jgi:uncharacterized protein
MPFSKLAPASPPALAPGVVVHAAGQGVDRLLEGFAAQLAARGFRVAGVVQRNAVGGGDGAGACADAMALVDLSSGRVVDISQRLGRGSSSCRVDPAGVAEASGLVRMALSRGPGRLPDLLVVNKFGALESEGGGLAAEIARAVADGIPVLTSVGGKHLSRWIEFAGGMGRMLPPDPAALWRWWGGCRLYRDLANGVEEDEVLRIECRPPWLLVRSGRGCGVARLARTAAVPDYPLRGLRRQGLKALAARVESWDPFDLALAVAAMNAHYNRPGLPAEPGNGLEAFAAQAGRMGGRAVVVGSFPDLRDRLPEAQVIEAAPAEGEYPAEAADWLVPGAAHVLLTGSSLANRSLPRLLALADGAPVSVVGPTTPLTDRLFSYGVQILAGFVSDDPDGLADAVAAGATPRQWTRFGRQVVLRRPG